MKKFIVLSLALLSFSAFAALSLLVKPLSGSECITALGNIGKIAYSGDSIYVYDCAKTLVFSDLLANVQHVRFSDEQPSTPTGVDDLQNNSTSQVLVYPNPPQDLLHVKNTQADVVRLYTLTGSLVQTTEVHNGEVQLNVSSCPVGSYLLLCGKEAFQIIKQ